MNWDLVRDVVYAGVERGNGSLRGEGSTPSGVVAAALGLAMNVIGEKIGDVANAGTPAVLLGGDEAEVLQLLQRAQRVVGDGVDGDGDASVRKVKGLVAIALSQSH
ncbi:MAG: hypothetical protein UX92_C0012G0021 [Candidatus Amesbacteria bacterium GW2011_GWA1_47_20]|uniref:Uncharacterized protein n=1 Tax=Candidatus Amesbacteria bacterium GW2011_GWA1_47_20 TaxID=1618354 RepID=A0A0G1UUH6_9BACT|nr:MAG: hypothetical protein UX92_C0012G0021 [Candidatus Amesbacteria bacterium GW2011_GWA1_47_20]